MAPTVSVVIPTYYRNQLLREAIESVIAQAYEPIELVVVDDSGTGHARPVIDAYRDRIDIVLKLPENRGWSGANTAGIKAATGEYIQLLDDDDRLRPGKLTETAAVLEQNPDVGVSYCGVIETGEGRMPPKPHVRGDILTDALRFRTYPVWTGSMLIERDVLMECLPLAGAGESHDLSVPLGDSDLKIALAKRTAFEYVEECLVVYRRHASRRWTGHKRFQKIRANVRFREALYAQYPEIRRAVLREWCRKEARYLFRERPFSPRSVSRYLESVVHAENGTVRRVAESAAALIGQEEQRALSRTNGQVTDS